MADTASSTHMPRVLSWRSGAFLGLTTILGVFATQGYMVGYVGAWAVLFIWGIAMTIATVQAFLYAEMATMFPDMSGGVAAYAHEGLRKYTVFIGPVVTWGYWLGYSLVQAVIALIFGELVQAQWFPGQTWGTDIGSVHVGLPHLLGAAALISVFLLNVFGIKPAARVTTLGVSIFAVAAAAMVILPFVTGTWSIHQLSWHLDSTRLALVLIYLASWTTFAAEGPSLFACEYRSPATDTPKAIRACAFVMLAVFMLVPFATTGAIGESAIAANPSGYAVDVMQKYWHGSSDLVIAILAIGLWVTLVGTSAQAARALLGISRADLTIKELSVLNRFGMPGRALTMDLTVNILVLFLVGNTVAIVAASNFGYVLCCGFACFAFVMLRRDRPKWPRPYRLPGFWVPIAIALGTIDLILAGVGIASPGTSGYGGTKETIISLALLFVCIPLFLVRRLWQDRDHAVVWREATPSAPGDEVRATVSEAGPVSGDPASKQLPA